MNLQHECDRKRSRAVAPWILFAACVCACGHAALDPADTGAVRDAAEGDAGRGDGSRVLDAAVAAGPHFTPPSQIVALGTWVPIRHEPRRDAPLEGYLRAGAVVAVDGMPQGREHCPARRDDPSGGWYHVAGGGYVCVGGALAVAWPARGMRRPAQPQLDAGMPYQYAAVYGSPIMYRAPPTMDDLRIYEPWRFHHDDADASTPSASEATPAAGEPNNAEPTGASEPAPAAPAETAAPSEPAPVPVPVPTSRHDRHDNEPPPGPPPATSTDTPNGEPSLRELRGDRGGPVIRRLLRGMFIALDRTYVSHSTGDRYWRTQSAGFVREGPLSMLRSVSAFSGVPIDATHTLPFAFMVSNTGWDYRVMPSGHAVSEHHRVPRLTPIQLTSDPPVAIGANTYYRTSEGFAVEARNVRIATLRPPPAGVAPAEKWIDIDLDAQILVAYEGARPVYVTLVSTGRRSDQQPERNYETPAGSFRIRGKHITTTMDGDTAADGPYSIEDVPWAMYFYESYALHGAFWHGNYGWRMSHGCVNLSPIDARWMFFWTEPQLPAGWHGVFATEQHPGTRIELHHGDHPTPRRPTL